MVKVALLVGVSEYEGLDNLSSAVEDAQAMAEVLQDPDKGGFEPEQVKILTNPKTQELRTAIYDLFVERSRDDLVLFYFSGHGVKDQNRNLYLTSAETCKNTKGLVVTPTAVQASYLQSEMSNCLSERQVIILDCCYSGAMAKGLTVKDEGEIDILAELGGKGRAILTSSTSVQSSFQQDNKLSIYTQYLVEGIRTGSADLDRDGRISVDELHQYAKRRVQEVSPAMTPQFYPVQEGYRIYLAKSLTNDPQLQYRKTVEEIVEENQGEIDEDFDRPALIILSDNLQLSSDITETIEAEVLEPFRQRQQKLELFQEFYSKVVKSKLSEDNQKRKIQRYKKSLGLRDEDIRSINLQSVEISSTKQIEKQLPSKVRNTKTPSFLLYMIDSDIIEDLVTQYIRKTIDRSEIIKVGATVESIGKRRSGDNTPLILTQMDEENEPFWVVTQYTLQNNCYFLVPKYGLIITDRIYQTIEDTFFCKGYKNRVSNDFQLILPAIVKSRSNNEWELVESGELLFEFEKE
ncbi:MAG: caspase domain-containing protein [Xenococcus sp. (in: cyanobacteria)]